MGLASSQARLLMLTSRKDDIESQLMTVANSKMALSRRAQNIADEYEDSLSATKYVWNQDGSESALNFSLFDPLKMKSNSDNAMLTDSATGAVFLTESDCTKLGISNLGGSGSDFKSAWSENAFIAKMILGDSSQASQIAAAKSQFNIGDDLASTTFTHFTTNYDDDDIREYLGENCSFHYAYQVDDITGQVTNASSLGYQYSDSADPVEVANIAYGNTTSVSYAVGLFVTDICSDVGQALNSTLAEQFGDEWDNVSDSIAAAQLSAMANTVQHYKDLTDDGTKASSYDKLSVIDGISVPTTAPADSMVFGSLGSASNFDGIVVNPGDVMSSSVYDKDGEQCEYIDVNQVVKMYLNYFDSACNDINDDGKINKTAGNYSAPHSYAATGTYTTTYNTPSGTAPNYTYDTSTCTYITYSAAGSVSRASVGGTGSENSTGIEQKTYSGNSDITNTAIYYYESLYLEICDAGWEVFSAGNTSENMALQNGLKDGTYSLKEYYTDTLSWDYTSINSADSPLTEETDSDTVSKAEAAYTIEKEKIQYKEDILDVESNNLDAERSEVTTEIESVKNILKSHYEGLKLFSASG